MRAVAVVVLQRPDVARVGRRERDRGVDLRARLVAIASTVVEAPMLAPTSASRCRSTSGRERSQRTAPIASGSRSDSIAEPRDW